MKLSLRLATERIMFIFCLAVSLFFVSAHAASPQRGEDGSKTSERKKLPKEEQDKKALEIFEKILNLTTKPDRKAVLPQMADLYEEIINNYPEASVAEESYVNLMNINLLELTPPGTEKAESLYWDFLAKHPDSPVKLKIEQTIGQYYYTNKMWDRLLRIFTPQVKKFIQTGKLDTPYPLFMYSEAKFNLGDIAEAEKGYKIIDSFFPNTKEGETSRNRLEDIKKSKKQSGGT